jgi:uncharacterized SAM-binding protein YcdF (DUF218 family)
MNEKPRIWLHLLALGLIVVCILFGVNTLMGKAFAEKTLQQLIAPVGLIWLAISLTSYFAIMYRAFFVFWLSFLCWIFLTIAGNGYLANQAAKRLEADYLDVTLENVGAFDAVAVLGGGTTIAANNEPQLGQSGDRVAAAARLYHAGKTRVIICTGSSPLAQNNGAMGPADSAYEILVQLGVDGRDIEIVGGPNTGEEMKSLANFLAEKNYSKIGLITSAWHMPRAMRLAKERELEFVPIPSNFRSRPDTVSPGWVIPGAESLETTQLVTKEWLAALVSR